MSDLPGQMALPPVIQWEIIKDIRFFPLLSTDHAFPTSFSTMHAAGMGKDAHQAY